MAAAAVVIAAVALIFFAEIQTFIWSGLILVTIAAGAIALVEVAGSQFGGNPHVDTSHAMLDRGVALAENALTASAICLPAPWLPLPQPLQRSRPKLWLISELKL